MQSVTFRLNNFRMELPHFKVIQSKKPLKVLVKSNVSTIILYIKELI